jgi:hypothetical protein
MIGMLLERNVSHWPRFLLDGRNSLDYKEATERFERMVFGAMAKECRDSILAVVKEGSAFRHSHRCVQLVGQKLAQENSRECR